MCIPGSNSIPHMEHILNPLLEPIPIHVLKLVLILKVDLI